MPQIFMKSTYINCRCWFPALQLILVCEHQPVLGPDRAEEELSHALGVKGRGQRVQRVTWNKSNNIRFVKFN